MTRAGSRTVGFYCYFCVAHTGDFWGVVRLLREHGDDKVDADVDSTILPHRTLRQCHLSSMHVLAFLSIQFELAWLELS